MARFFYQGFNIRLAVMARKILMMEIHPTADCQKLVYEPTRRLLRKMALAPPSMLLCLHGTPYTYGGIDGLSADVDIITPDKQVVYLATIVSRPHAQSALDTYKEEFQGILDVLQGFHAMLDNLFGRKSQEEKERIKTEIQQKLELQESNIRHRLQLLSERGEMAIIHERVGCKIPVDSDKLDIRALEKGVKRYFQGFVPQLAEIDIVWMPPKKQRALRIFIRKQAEQISTPQTDEERRKIISQDL